LGILIIPFLIHISQLNKKKIYLHNNIDNITIYQYIYYSLLYIFNTSIGNLIAVYIFNIQIYHTNYYNIYDFFSLIITLIILEFISYIIHRIQHIPFIYKLSHIHHHQKKYVNIWMTYFSNPFDYLMTSIP
jgi:sterol desaturase/sphingolipid hydroxylase (fatty acid hydroxylase superfamily)